MSRVLVTGAAGFVGANLVRALQASGNEVSVFLRRESKTWRLADLIPKLKVYPVDISDKEAVQKAVAEIQPEVVYHLATYGGYPSQKDIAVTFNTNLLGSLNLFQALESADSLKKLVNIGSSSEYGIKIDLRRETDFLEPTTSYGVAKASQTLLANYLGKQKNFPVVTLRPFSVFGPYEEPGRLITDLMLAAVSDRTAKLSSPLTRRDFIYVDDILAACFRAAEISGQNGEVFNIGRGRDQSIGDAVSLLEEIVGQKLSVEWGAEDKKRSFDTDQKWIADISKAKKYLGWEPAHSFKDGLEKTYQWYCKNISLYS